MRKYIHHISEEDFESVCRKYKSLRYIPADWSWHAYPDVGFADIVGDKDRLTWGCHRYTEDATEDVIRRESDGKEFVVDTKDELRELIRDTFGEEL